MLKKSSEFNCGPNCNLVRQTLTITHHRILYLIDNCFIALFLHLSAEFSTCHTLFPLRPIREIVVISSIKHGSYSKKLIVREMELNSPGGIDGVKLLRGPRTTIQTCPVTNNILLRWKSMCYCFCVEKARKTREFPGRQTVSCFVLCGRR